MKVSATGLVLLITNIKSRGGRAGSRDKLVSEQAAAGFIIRQGGSGAHISGHRQCSNDYNSMIYAIYNPAA